jgi:hypothetical protein
MILYDKKCDWRIISHKTFNDEYLAFDLQDNVLISHQGDADSNNVTISAIEPNKIFALSPEELFRTWVIGLVAAKKTIAATTQKGVRLVALPNVKCRWPRGNDHYDINASTI